MTKDRIKELLAKANEGTLNDEEREEIRNAAKEEQLRVNFKTKCKNCWSDALMMLANKESVKNRSKNITDEPFDNILLTKRKGSPTMRTYKGGSWMEVDETTEKGMAHLRELWESKHQHTVLMFYRAEVKEAGKEVDDGRDS